MAAVALVAVGWFAFRPGTSASPDETTPRAPQSPQVNTEVIRVLDGDTLRVRLDGQSVRVRLLGIDAPEVSHKGSTAECFGDKATRELERLAPVGNPVILTGDGTQPDVDRYGRLLRYVEHDSVDVGQKLLRRGAAERYRNRPPIDRSAGYDQAVKRAKSERLGLWKSC